MENFKVIRDVDSDEFFIKGSTYLVSDQGYNTFHIINEHAEGMVLSGYQLWSNFSRLENRVKPIFIKSTNTDSVLGYTLYPEGEGKPEEKTTEHKGLRHNKGKLRYDLLHPIAVEGLVRVLTKGSIKYAARNWEKGLSWSEVIGCLKRHTAALEKGIDYDIDLNCEDCKKSTKENWLCKNHTGELHVDLIQANAHFLSAFYKTYPQGDDRPHKYLTQPKIGLDIDEVLCDWIGAWTDKFNLDQPEHWAFDPQLVGRFHIMKQEGKIEEFFLSLKPLIRPDEIPFEPHCYITSRPVDSAVTTEWLTKHGFPLAPVYTTDEDNSKVDIAKREGIDIFVDDAFHNFKALNEAGICCFLMDACHNQRYDVGFKRIKHLKDLV